MRTPITIPQSSAHRQHGAVLITALIILLVLALLGVTAMNSTAMEQKMAGNTMATNIAFQAAESGLAGAVNSSVDLFQTVDVPEYPIGRGAASVQTAPKGMSKIRRSDSRYEVYGLSGYEYAEFEQTSTGRAGDARVVLHQGMKQIIHAE